MNMTVRCKFYCESVTKTWNAYEKRFIYGYKFRPVTGDSVENKEFFAWTPSGFFEVGTVTCDQFESGKEYYLDISEAVKPEPAAPQEENS